MKRIGVITMHRVTNYGSALQAYATQCIFEQLGHKCEIIDYTYPNEFQYEKGAKRTPMSLKNKIGKLLGLSPRWRRVNRIDRFCRKRLKLSKKYSTHNSIKSHPPKYDIYVTGSDQVWNPTFMKGDDVFFLSFAPEGAHKIAFSSSFAIAHLPKQYKDNYAKFLKAYRYISVREQKGRDIIKELLNTDTPITLDPTLMLDNNEWQKLIKSYHDPYQKKKYILLYMLGYAFDPTPYIYELLQALQKKTNLDIYTFSTIPPDYNMQNVHNIFEASPISFIQLFKNASYIVTSSFHGTAFAVNFGIPLYSVVASDDSDDDRQSSLLNALNIPQCIVIKGSNFVSINPYYDVKKEQAKLNILRKLSLDYLNKALS